MIQRMEQLHQQHGVSLRRQCDLAGVAYSSFMRWKARVRAGQPVLQPPGPRKVGRLNLARWEDGLQALKHGSHRSLGLGRLQADHSHCLSRREVSCRVRQRRRDHQKARAAHQSRLAWKTPRMIWALDDSLWVDPAGRRWYLHAVEDLASRFQFGPLLTPRLCSGEQVAHHLQTLFLRYGPPLFLKCDGGSNLHETRVQAILEEHGVIPLTSPRSHPRYNGGIERAHRSCKAEIRSVVQGGGLGPIRERIAEVTHQLNHRPCSSLGGLIPCATFFGAPRLDYPKRKRLEVMQWLEHTGSQILESTAGRVSPTRAWRLAIEAWLLQAGAIEYTQNPKVLPLFNSPSFS